MRPHASGNGQTLENLKRESIALNEGNSSYSGLPCFQRNLSVLHLGRSVCCPFQGFSREYHGDALPKVARTTSLVYTVFQMYGMDLNFAPGKSAVVLSFRGPGATKIQDCNEGNE